MKLFFLNEVINAYVSNIVEKSWGRLVLSGIYHDLEVGDSLQVRISGKSRRGQPMFKLNEYLGFVTNRLLRVGDEADIQIKKIKHGKGGIELLETIAMD